MFSIIIPTFNNLDYLKLCLRSLKKNSNYEHDIIIFINVLRGVYHRRGHYEMVEKVGLYWHYVDLVWEFVFTFFYLV